MVLSKVVLRFIAGKLLHFDLISSPLMFRRSLALYVGQELFQPKQHLLIVFYCLS